MRKTLALIAVGLVATAAHALEGRNGSTATALFTAADVRAAVQYDAGFQGARWADLDLFSLGSWQATGTTGGAGERPEVAVSSAGDVFFLVSGGNEGTSSVSPTYSGLIHYDGADHFNLVQDELSTNVIVDSVGSFMRTLTISPVTAGRLTADDPVLTRYARSTVGGPTTFEIWSVDPTASPAAQTLVYSWDSALNPCGVVAIDAAGILYVMAEGIQDASGTWLDGTIRKLEWNGSGYDESSLTTEPVGEVLTCGADGALYTFPQYPGFGQSNATIDLLRIDSTDGGSSVHCSIKSSGTHLNASTWDAAGKFWLALTDSKNAFGYVVEAKPGDTLTTRSARKRIAEWTGPRSLLRSMAPGPDGDLYVIQEGDQPLDDFAARRLNDTLYALTPGSGGGKGKGGGKGRNK